MIGRIRQLAYQFRKKSASQALVLMYHRVAQKDVDPWSLSVTPQHFAQHLNILQKKFTPVSLPALAQFCRQGTIPERAVAITFDDGYANNLFNAKPLLEQFHIPATVFVSTGFMGQNREFWWDELEQVLLQPGQLPPQLCLKINGRSQRWQLGAAADYDEAAYQQDHQRYAHHAEPGSRLNLYYLVWQQLQALPHRHRQQVLDDIVAWANARPSLRSTHRAMSPQEVRWLAAGGLVDIGAHTVSHPLLPAHALAVQREEIEQSKISLEEILGRPVTSFSYPWGAGSKDTVKLVERAGFNCACATVAETVWRKSNLFRLPRFEVFDWAGPEFEQRLWQWFQN